MNEDKKLQSDLRFSATVMVILVAVNVVEFWFALVVKSQFVLFGTMAFLALVDTGLIMSYYMHIFRLFESDDEGSHS